MKTSKILSLITITSIFLLYPSLSAHSLEYKKAETWKCIELSRYQYSQFKQLDKDWDTTLKELQPQINQSQRMFNQKYSDPNTREIELRRTYLRLIAQQQELKQHALEIYLAKRRLLSPTQMKIMGKGCR